MKKAKKGRDIQKFSRYTKGNVAEDPRRYISAAEPSVTPVDFDRSGDIRHIRIWTIDDVAEFTGFAKSTIYRMTSRREIPHRKRRKKLFFFPEEIWNWIEEA